MVDDLAARLERAEAAASWYEAAGAARRLIEQYASACDRNDVAAAVVLFAPDGVLITPVEQFTGRPAIDGFFRPRLDRPTRHMVVVTDMVSSGPGELEARSEFVAFAGGATPEVTWGTYRDNIRIRDGRAEFARRTIGVDGVADPAAATEQMLGRTGDRAHR